MCREFLSLTAARARRGIASVDFISVEKAAPSLVWAGCVRLLLKVAVVVSMEWWKGGGGGDGFAVSLT